MATVEELRLSLVLAAGDSPASIPATVAHLCDRLPEAVELIVVGGGELPPGRLPPRWVYRRVDSAPGSLVPEQWGMGLRVASASLVAFMSTGMHLAPRWWVTLNGALQDPTIAAVASGIVLARDGRSSAGAFLARYSAFLPPRSGLDEDRPDLPGEATIYRRALLMDQAAHEAGGFWEVAYHRELRRGGWRLRLLAQPLTSYVGTPTTVELMRQRCRHATQFGAMRVNVWHESPLGIALRAPLIPAVLVYRILRRCLLNPWGRYALARGVAPLLLAALAWGWGEAVGAWHADRAA